MILACCASRHKEKEFEKTDPVVSEVTPSVSTYQAVFSWQVDLPGKFQTAVEVSKQESMANFIEEGAYTIIVDNVPEEGGSVSGGGTYNHGASCTVIATEAEGYSFSNWTENGTPVSYDANYTFIVNSDHTLVANFTPLPPNTYNINVSPNPSDGGTVTGGGTYTQGQQCTVTATAAAGYNFLRWTENGNLVSENPIYQFTVTGSRTLVAQFQLINYNINVSADPTNGGSVTGSGAFHYNDTITVSATANAGFSFTNWTENGYVVSTNANYTFVVNSNRILVAHFTRQFTITVSANPTNGGAPYIGNTPGTTQATFTNGQSCTVHANPANGYEFVNWTVNGGQVSTNANYTFTVTSNHTLVAHFTPQAPNTYTITATADPANGGSVTGGGTYEQGATCTLTATPNTNAGYEFVNWMKNGQQVSTNPTCSFPVTESAAYVAHFRLKSFTINVSADPSNGGTVSGGGTYNFCQSCTLSATPNSNYAFEKWTKNGTQVSDNPTYTFTVTGNASYVAHFKKQACTIKVLANPTNGGSVYIGNTPGTTQATYTYGESCTVHANPANGYTFTNWTEADLQVSTSADYSFTVERDRTLVANFADANACIIYVDIVPEIGGTATGAGAYSIGDECTLEAFAKPGYKFKNWTKDDEIICQSSNYTFTVTETARYVAHFEEKTYTITTTVDPEESGTVLGGGNYHYGANCTLKATANPGYVFSHWMKDDNTIIIENPYTFVVWDAASFTAFFELESTQQHTITATANPEEGGTVTGGGTYASDVTCILKATPNTGYTFINWTENGTAVSSNATYTFTVTNDRNLIANFEKDEVPCIDNDKIQKIVPKDHTEEYETYTLILVYPNPDEEYVYQWCYASETDSLYYRDLNVNDGTYNKQYFYRGGALLRGYYKVRISKEKGGCSPVETEPYHVTYKRATQLRIYPNPSRRDHNIVVVNESDGPSQLSIYSTDGRLLHAQTVTDSQTTINLNLPSGVYIAYLTNSEGCTKVGKLIIQ